MMRLDSPISQDDYIIPDTLNNELDVSNLLNSESNEILFSPEKCFSINLGEAIWRPKFKKKDEFVNSDSNNLAQKILDYRKSLLDIKDDRILQLKTILNEKILNGYFLTDEEEKYFSYDLSRNQEIEEKYMNKFILEPATENELNFDSIAAKVDQSVLDSSYSDMNLHEILVKINGRNQPNKKIANELTKTAKKSLVKSSEPKNGLDKSLIRSLPGLFSLLRLILVNHEIKRSETKQANANSRMPSLTIPQIVEKVNVWQNCEEIHRLNSSWISKTSDWRVYVEPSLRFLTADPAIDLLSGKTDSPCCSRPFVEFKNRTQNCSWITATNKNYDDETAMEEHKRLSRIFPEWFKFAHKHHKYLQTLLINSKQKVKIESQTSSGNGKAYAAKKSSKSMTQNGKVTDEPQVEEDIPPCTYTTDWVVQPSTHDERLEFQRQEMERFSKPWMPFVYQQHGFISIVGPLRSYLRQSDPSSVAGMKPRSHPLLRNDRPSIVGLADIVRDAVARLPNGEGTRNDIVTLAMDSSFLITKYDEKQLHQCISGALDRLQCEPDTPVVYRQARRVWIYKHRHRSAEDFLEIYQTQKDIQAKKKELKRSRPQSGLNTNNNFENNYESHSKIRRISTDVNNTFSSRQDLLHQEATPSRKTYNKSHRVSSKVYSNSSAYDQMQEDIPDIDDLLNSNDPDLDSCRSSSSNHHRTSLVSTYENFNGPSNNTYNNYNYNKNQSYRNLNGPHRDFNAAGTAWPNNNKRSNPNNSVVVTMNGYQNHQPQQTNGFLSPPHPPASTLTKTTKIHVQRSNNNNSTPTITTIRVHKTTPLSTHNNRIHDQLSRRINGGNQAITSSTIQSLSAANTNTTGSNQLQQSMKFTRVKTITIPNNNNTSNNNKTITTTPVYIRKFTK